MNDARPLAGRRFLVTRRAEQAEPLQAALVALGAEVVELPLLVVLPPADLRPLDQALMAVTDGEWIAFASANAVEAVRARLDACGRPLSPGVLLASVGEATTLALQAAFAGRRVHLEPTSDFGAAGLLAAFTERGCIGVAVLLPRSEVGRDDLERGLRALGAEVRVVTAYRVVPPPELPKALAEAIAGGLDGVLFASPSAVLAYRAACGGAGLAVPAVVIGPTTAAAAEAAGLRVAAVAQPSTTAGLVAAAVRAIAERGAQVKDK